MTPRSRSGLTSLLVMTTVTLAMGGWRSLSAHQGAASRPRPVDESDDARAAAEMAYAADNLWDALTPEQQKQIGFDFNASERTNWAFVPLKRLGLSFKEMTPNQRPLAFALLSSGLSHRGFQETTSILSLEQILLDVEKGAGPKRDPEDYHFWLFGTPGDKDAWGWRFEGHHVSMNFTIIGGRALAGAPAFMGANPASVPSGPRKGLEVLGLYEHDGRAFVQSLDAGQQKKAIMPTTAPRDIITGNNRKADLGKPTGISFGELNAAQQKSLQNLVKLYATRHRSEMATDDLAKVDKAGWDKVFFAWAGKIEPGQPHYYRIHGPTFLVEFDNTQNNANHIHSVWRDLTNDFGDDELLRHYQEHHHDQ